MKKNHLLMLLMAALFLAQSCKKGMEPVQEAPELSDLKGTDSISTLINYLSRANGILTKNIAYESKERLFYMEGDIIVSREDAEHGLKASADLKKLAATKGGVPNATSQRQVATASQTAVTMIRVKIECANQGWIDASKQAINNFNTPSLRTISKIRMVEVTSSPYDIRIYDTGAPSENGNHDFAAAPNPSGNAVGSYVKVYSDHDYETVAKKTLVITHELGHTLGLKHTNSNDGTIVSGTNQYDVYSFMNAPNLPNNYVLDDFKGFSYYDLIALKTMYPRTLSSWELMSGSASKMYISYYGDYLMTGPTTDGTGNYDWRRWSYNGPYTYSSDPPKAYKMAALGGGEYYFIKADKTIWKTHYNFPYEIQMPGEAIDISVGGYGALFIVSNTPINSEGNMIMKWNGSAWVQYTTYGAKRIEVGASYVPMPKIIDNSGHVKQQYPTGNFLQIGTELASDICTTQNTYYGVETTIIVTKTPANAYGDYTLMRWTGVDWYPIVGGAAKSIAVDSQGDPWITNSSNQIWRNKTLQ